MFATRLKELRAQRGYTLEELASLVGISKTQVGRWERGQIPGADMVEKLAKTFSVSADYLLGLTENPRGYVLESELSAQELQLLDALRNGALHKALQLIVSMSTNGEAERGVERS